MYFSAKALASKEKKNHKILPLCIAHRYRFHIGTHIRICCTRKYLQPVYHILANIEKNRFYITRDYNHKKRSDTIHRMDDIHETGDV